MPKSDFDKILLEAVDEGLSLLGESSRQAIYFHLEKSFNIEKQKIPYKIETFADAIEKIFGLGAKRLEIMIMKQLYKKAGGSVQLHGLEDLTFTEYVAAVKRSLMEKKKTKKITEKLVHCEEML